MGCALDSGGCREISPGRGQSSPLRIFGLSDLRTFRLSEFLDFLALCNKGYCLLLFGQRRTDLEDVICSGVNLVPKAQFQFLVVLSRFLTVKFRFRMIIFRSLTAIFWSLTAIFRDSGVNFGGFWCLYSSVWRLYFGSEQLYSSIWRLNSGSERLSKSLNLNTQLIFSGLEKSGGCIWTLDHLRLCAPL